MFEQTRNSDSMGDFLVNGVTDLGASKAAEKIVTEISGNEATGRAAGDAVALGNAVLPHLGTALGIGAGLGAAAGELAGRTIDWLFGTSKE